MINYYYYYYHHYHHNQHVHLFSPLKYYTFLSIFLKYLQAAKLISMDLER